MTSLHTSTLTHLRVRGSWWSTDFLSFVDSCFGGLWLNSTRKWLVVCAYICFIQSFLLELRPAVASESGLLQFMQSLWKPATVQGPCPPYQEVMWTWEQKPIGAILCRMNCEHLPRWPCLSCLGLDCGPQLDGRISLNVPSVHQYALQNAGWQRSHFWSGRSAEDISSSSTALNLQVPSSANRKEDMFYKAYRIVEFWRQNEIFVQITLHVPLSVKWKPFGSYFIGVVMRF